MHLQVKLYLKINKLPAFRNKEYKLIIKRSEIQEYFNITLTDQSSILPQWGRHISVSVLTYQPETISVSLNFNE